MKKIITICGVAASITWAMQAQGRDMLVCERDRNYSNSCRINPPQQTVIAGPPGYMVKPNGDKDTAQAYRWCDMLSRDYNAGNRVSNYTIVNRYSRQVECRFDVSRVDVKTYARRMGYNRIISTNYGYQGSTPVIYIKASRN